VEAYVNRLARALVQLGHRPSVFTQADRRTVSELGRTRFEDGVWVHRYARPHALVRDVPAPALLWTTRRRSGEFDLVHTHSYHQLPALGIALSEPRLPIVTTLHYNGDGSTAFRRIAHRAYRPLGRLLVRRASAVIALTDSEARRVNALSSRLGGATVAVIPPGIDPPPAVPEMPTAGRTILAVGRLERGKRFDVLIDALAHLPADVRLVIAGTGPEAHRLRARADLLRVSDRVDLLGWLDPRELGRWRSAASVFATASERESFHLSLAEALASGLPAVASAIPAHEDAATLPNARVRLVAAADALAWAAALREGLALPRAAPVRFATWPEIGREVSVVYSRAIAGGQAAGHPRRRHTPVRTHVPRGAATGAARR
jgi:glycosyltransferase involved in cell wall biosynthesis